MIRPKGNLGMINKSEMYDVINPVPGLRLVMISLMMFTSSQTAIAQTTTNKVDMKIISVYTTQVYNDHLSDPSDAAFVQMNTTSCGDIIDAVKTEGKILTCTVDHFENDTSGLKAVINVTAELGDKSITERFTMIKTAVLTSAADKSTWIITNGDITLITDGTLPPETVTDIEMTVISTRYDLTFSEELTDPKEFLYSMTTTTMCSDVVDALTSVGKVGKCEVEHFQNGVPSGVKAYIRLVVSATNKNEREGFIVVGATIIDAASERERWNVTDGDMKLTPAICPPINERTTVDMKIISTRTDLTELSESDMCSDVKKALSGKAIVRTCVAENPKSSDKGITADLRVKIGIDANGRVVGFSQAADIILDAASKRDVWIIDSGDITARHDVLVGVCSTDDDVLAC
ncbi:hypothetical protein LSH36_222g02015 [Paralvinella palmiformis]|uniref:Uncharacterized protein n=1 Tax=Paralvinella palmiformis TaxID=53620 RepID=A0AAD9JQ46_9ANNE|nr:hypothetical protein LSH36_222g02015 [Paralvinella palmiformis]